MSMLELKGVEKAYGEGATVVNALRGVNLSVGPGAMVAVMGPSGSGKSTLLTIAGSLEEPTGGEVLIDGAPLCRMWRNAEAVMRLVHDACKRGVAAVVVTHDAQLASWADRVVFLRDGRIVDQTGPQAGPESLLTGRGQAQ